MSDGQEKLAIRLGMIYRLLLAGEGYDAFDEALFFMRASSNSHTYVVVFCRVFAAAFFPTLENAFI